MRTSPLIALGVLIAALMGHSGAGQNIPTNWLTIERKAFSFRVPPDMTSQILQESGTGGVPACVSSNLVLTFAYYPDPGWTVSRPEPGVKQRITSIDGHTAQVESYHMIFLNDMDTDIFPFLLHVGKTNVIRLYAKDG